jgi:hypothetical protein
MEEPIISFPQLVILTTSFSVRRDAPPRLQPQGQRHGIHWSLTAYISLQALPLDCIIVALRPSSALSKRLEWVDWFHSRQEYVSLNLGHVRRRHLLFLS